MRKLHRIIFLATLACSSIGVVSAKQDAMKDPKPPSRPGWKLAWHDEFDGPEVDPKNWEILTRKNNYNEELQYYVPEQATIIDGGILRLAAIDTPKDGKKYQSARIESWFTQAFGRFECRAKIPATQGTWPAFWLLPRPADWPRRGEIDILESKGSDPKWHSSAFHFADPESRKHKYVTHARSPKDAKGKLIDLSKDFHVYAVEWDADEMRFYLDDEKEPYYTVTKKDAPISDQPMCVILNLAIGGWFGGNPDNTSKFPQFFDIDYVRVWQKNAKD